jgi:glycerol-3-phosphate dehydrogenase subunit C
MAVEHTTKEFWNQEALETEFQRVFDICNGCRLCFNLCPSFQTLLTTIDTKGEEVENLDSEDYRRIVDLCYHCKLCYNVCPYIPPHRWAVDFPRLMLRGKLVKARNKGIPWRDRILGDTDLVGSLGCATAPLSNWANQNSATRLVLQEVMGIHPDRNLPEFHHETFQKWHAKHENQSNRPIQSPNGKVALFYTCSVNYNNPEIGRATVQVLEKNDVDIFVPPQKCCGMPYLDAGDLGSAIKNMNYNLTHMNDAVEQGYEIVTPGPTCSLMLKQEYMTLTDDERAKRISEHTFDICEYLMKLHEQGKLDTAFAQGAGRVAYHLPCHLRAQNIGYKSRDLLQLLPNTQVQTIEQCSAHDGTWAAKREFYQISLKWAGKLFNQVNEADAEVVASDCPLAGLQITKGTNRKPYHPVQIIAQAYGIDDDVTGGDGHG